ncbi:MAG: DUF998 domain-containing protein [Pseudomonadota bacterium]
MPQQDARVFSHLATRRAIGLLGMALPIVLYIYARQTGAGMQPSISDFYNTAFGDYLVGSLVAAGFFLISYKGYARLPGERLSDRWVATLAGLGAIGVALFPTTPAPLKSCTGTGALGSGYIPQGFTFHWEHMQYLHFGSALLFFICLAIFCLRLFPKTPDGQVDYKRDEHPIYLACGIAIVVSIVALIPTGFVSCAVTADLNALNYVFWVETLAVFAFGISWLVKGKAIAGVLSLLK